MRRGFWNSFAGLLRSHLAALEVAGTLKDAKLDEPLDMEVYVSAKSSFLSIWLNEENGKGTYNALSENNREECNPWFMSADGMFEVDGKSMSMEVAAKHFAAKLVN